MLPVDFRWSHRPEVTLLGDAAYLMTPFAGEGINLAFEDSMKLAKPSSKLQSLAEKLTEKGMLNTSIAAYEEELFKRINRAQNMTNNMMRHMFFTEEAPRSTIEACCLKDDLQFQSLASSKTF